MINKTIQDGFAVVCNDYHFCVKDFAWEMIEESNVM